MREDVGQFEKKLLINFNEHALSLVINTDITLSLGGLFWNVSIRSYPLAHLRANEQTTSAKFYNEDKERSVI
jgi:hypothetical protein